MELLLRDPQFPRFLALLLAFLMVVLWLRSQPEWLLVVLPVFALTFLGFDRLADGMATLLASGDFAPLAVGAALMSLPAFAIGFALGRRARRPAYPPYRAPEPVAPLAPTTAEPARIDPVPTRPEQATETVVVRPSDTSPRP